MIRLYVPLISDDDLFNSHHADLPVDFCDFRRLSSHLVDFHAFSSSSQQITMKSMEPVRTWAICCAERNRVSPKKCSGGLFTYMLRLTSMQKDGGTCDKLPVQSYIGICTSYV